MNYTLRINILKTFLQLIVEVLIPSPESHNKLTSPWDRCRCWFFVHPWWPLPFTNVLVNVAETHGARHAHPECGSPCITPVAEMQLLTAAFRKAVVPNLDRTWSVTGWFLAASKQVWLLLRHPLLRRSPVCFRNKAWKYVGNTGISKWL